MMEQPWLGRRNSEPEVYLVKARILTVVLGLVKVLAEEGTWTVPKMYDKLTWVVKSVSALQQLILHQIRYKVT